MLLLALLQHFYGELARFSNVVLYAVVIKLGLVPLFSTQWIIFCVCKYQYEMAFNYTLKTMFHTLQSFAYCDGIDLFLGSLKVVIQKGSTRYSVLSFISQRKIFFILIVAPCISSNYLISIPTDAHTQKFHIKTLKSLRRVSILRSTSGSYTFLAKVTIKSSHWLISLYKQGVVAACVSLCCWGWPTTGVRPVLCYSKGRTGRTPVVGHSQHELTQ